MAAGDELRRAAGLALAGFKIKRQAGRHGDGLRRRAGSASRPRASPLSTADRIIFAKRIILKWTRKANAELEPAGGTVVLIVMDGDAIFKPQRAEFGDVDVQTQAPVVIPIISGS